MSETATTEAPATVPVEITSRWDNARVLFRAEVDASIPLFGRIKAAVLLALKEKANLRDADLGDANLRCADLRGADLRCADLGGADMGGAKIRLSNGAEILLAGGRSILTIGPIGSEGGTLLIYRATDGALYAQRGCFGPAPMSEFADAVEEKHGSGLHGVEYRAAVTMAQAWGSAV